MIVFSVEVTDSALIAISAQANYLAIDCLAPENARRWLQQVWDAIKSLEQFPRRAVVAEENAFVDYEVRQLPVGSHLLLFTIDDETQVIQIIGFRHGCRLARAGDMLANRDKGPLV